MLFDKKILNIKKRISVININFFLLFSNFILLKISLRFVISEKNPARSANKIIKSVIYKVRDR